MDNFLPERRNLVHEGDILVLEPRDYLSGSQRLRFRVTFIPANADLVALDWVWLRGVTVTVDGGEIEPRTLLIRAQAIRDNPDRRTTS
ncbi:hypothetical protein [Micromonospora sp. SH-82]|uniref:hypothetical protein n=1 Tax=Micromonospora sp. SH-82 TaxID=3132938 RepID=UPI003EBA75B1